MSCKNCKRLEQRIIQLEKLVAELEAGRARHENSNTPPSAGGSYPQREPSGKPPGAQLGHAGTTREQKKPDEIRDAPSLTKCPECQHMLGDPIGAIPCIFEDIPKPQPAKIIQVNQSIYECPGCGEILIAEDSQCPKSGRFGFNLIAEAVMMRFEQRLPLRKIQQALHNQFQLDLTPASIWMLIKRAAAAGEEEYNK